MHAYVHSKQEQTVFLPGNLSIAFNYKFRVDEINCVHVPLSDSLKTPLENTKEFDLNFYQNRT